MARTFVTHRGVMFHGAPTHASNTVAPSNSATPHTGVPAAQHLGVVTRPLALPPTPMPRAASGHGLAGLGVFGKGNK